MRFVDLVDGTDIGMIQPRRGLRFAEESFLLIGEMGWEQFQGDGAAEFIVLGLVDDAHPALTELFENSIMADDCPGHRLLLLRSELALVILPSVLNRGQEFSHTRILS